MKDYEKKYKEALERAKKYKLKEDLIITQDIFPELKESEDEKMIKSMTRLVKAFYDVNFPTPEGFTKEDMLAWLEKQGEQKSYASETMNEKGDFDNGFTRMMEKEQNPVIEMKTPEESLGINSNTYNKIVDECVYGDDKPAWSEEDTNLREATIGLLNLIHPIDAKSWGKSRLDCIDWLKSLKDRVQPKQEWGEEDEEMLRRCISATFDHGYLKECDWLKSLRPQSQWRPSKGQLECLGYAIEKAEKDWSPLTNNRIYLTLKALKEQLLELRESKV